MDIFKDCMWTLSAPPDKLIAIRFICDFEIEAVIKGNNILCYDLLTIEGKSTQVHTSIKKLYSSRNGSSCQTFLWIKEARKIHKIENK